MKAPLRGLLSLLGGDAAMRAIGFVITAYLARVLEPAAFGMISIGMAVLGYLQLVGSPGIQVLETRNVAAATYELGPRAGAVISLRIVLALILLALTAALLWFSMGSADLRAVIILHAVSLLPMALFLDWVLQGKEQFLSLSVARVLGYVAYAASVFLLVRSAGDVRLAPTGFFVGNMITALIIWGLVARAHSGIALIWDPAAWKSILLDNIPVGAALVLGQMIVNFPPLLVAALLTTVDVGVYSAAMKLVFLFLLLDRVLNAMLLPVVTRVISTRPDETHRLVSLTMKVVLLGALPLAVCGVVGSHMLVHIVFGSSYESSIPIVQILMAYVALTLLNSIFVCIVLGAKKEKRYLRAIMIGTVALIVATVVLTPLLGLIGTAIGVVLGEGVTAGFMALEAASVVKFPSVRSIAKPFFGALGMATIAWLMRGQHPALTILISLAVFAVLATMVRSLVPEEIRYLRERLV